MATIAIEFVILHAENTLKPDRKSKGLQTLCWQEKQIPQKREVQIVKLNGEVPFQKHLHRRHHFYTIYYTQSMFVCKLLLLPSLASFDDDKINFMRK